MLECHPFDPRLCLSAGYDGFTILWDIEKGTQLVRCEKYSDFLIFLHMDSTPKLVSVVVAGEDNGYGVLAWMHDLAVSKLRLLMIDESA